MNLSIIEGTVSFAVTNNTKKLNDICMSNKLLKETKRLVIEVLNSTSKDCPSRVKIYNEINKKKSNTDIAMYLYNIVLASEGSNVIK